jgi:tripartite-type tricarboxylate transporter receptor subunit TctC
MGRRAAGRSHRLLADAAQWAPNVEAGQFRILAMATEQRVPKYPNVLSNT